MKALLQLHIKMTTHLGQMESTSAVQGSTQTRIGVRHHVNTTEGETHMALLGKTPN